MCKLGDGHRSATYRRDGITYCTTYESIFIATEDKQRAFVLSESERNVGEYRLCCDSVNRQLLVFLLDN